MVVQLLRVNSSLELSGYNIFFLKHFSVFLNHTFIENLVGLFLHMVDFIQCMSFYYFHCQRPTLF